MGKTYVENSKKYFTRSDEQRRYIKIHMLLSDDYPDDKIRGYVILPLLKSTNNSGIHNRLNSYKREIKDMIDSNASILNKSPIGEVISVVMNVSKVRANEWVNAQNDIAEWRRS